MHHRGSQKTQQTLRLACVLGLVGVGILTWAQGRHFRRHTAIAKRTLSLVSADKSPPGNSQHSFATHHGHRHVVSNGIPNHDVGQFPNRGNPHSIRVQRYNFLLPLDPKPAEQITPLHLDAYMACYPPRVSWNAN